MTKKNATKKPKMKKMFAAMQTIVDREDPEDSSFDVIGVYSSEKIAQAALKKAKQEFLNDIPCADDKDPEEMLEDDYDRMYDWNVISVNVEI